MSDPVLIALIAGTPGIITAITQLFSARKIDKVKQTTEDTRSRVNGRMDQMLAMQHEKGYNQGIIDAKKGNNDVQT